MLAAVVVNLLAADWLQVRDCFGGASRRYLMVEPVEPVDLAWASPLRLLVESVELLELSAVLSLLESAELAAVLSLLESAEPVELAEEP